MPSTIEFLKLILPSQGLYIGWVKRGEEHTQRVFYNFEQLLAWLGEFSAHGWNVYHALGGFDHMRGQLNPTTGKREKPRGANNTLFFRSLFTDADSQVSHPNAVYRTQAEAYQAGLDFARNAKIPPPLPVNSGGGIHNYWPLDRDIDRALFLRLAEGLKRACIRYRFHVDNKVTANAAQVLRTPGFLHTRLQRLVQVGELIPPYSVDQFMHLLEGEDDYKPRSISTGHSVPAGQPSTSVGRLLTQSIRYNPSDPSLVRRNCAQIRRVIESPATCSEPLHRITGGVFKHCEGGTDYYVQHLDDNWKDRGRAKCDAWTVGPPYCGSFEQENPGGCAGCYFFDGSKQGADRFKITSPTHSGRFIIHSQEAQEAHRAQQENQGDAGAGQDDGQAPEINGHHVNGNLHSLGLSNIHLPQPFAWWKRKPEDPHEHLVYWEKDADDPKSEPIIVSHNPIYLASVHRSEAGEAGGCLYAFRQWLPHEGWKTIGIPAGDMWNQQSLVALNEGGANVRHQLYFKQYVQLAVDMLNEDGARRPRYEQCGWKKGPGGKRIGFLQGALMIERGRVYEVVVNEELRRRAKFLGPVEGGSVRGWQAAAKQLMPPHDWAAWYSVMCGLGAVFLCFLHATESGPIVNNRDIGSGTGKSRRLRAVASLWGLWDGVLILNYDTSNAAAYMRSILNHLPFVHDELGVQMKQRDAQILSFLVNMLTEGRDKRRMESGGKKLVNQLNTFQSLEIAASNESCHDHFRVHSKGTDAHILRCQEITSRSATTLSAGTADRLEIELFKNGGWVGQTFISWLLENDANMAFAEERLSYWVEYLYCHTNFEQKHRFYVRTLAAAAAAGDVSKRMGNLLPCDPYWVIDQVLEEQKAKTGEKRPDDSAHASDGEAAMAQFLAEHNGNTLRVHGPYLPGAQKFDPPPWMRPSGKLLIRYEMLNERAYIPINTFREFCLANGFSYADVVSALVAARFIVSLDKQVTLAAGTTLPGVRARCIVIDCSHAIMQNMPSLKPEQPDDNSERESRH